MNDSNQAKHTTAAEPGRATEALLESEARYRKLLEAAPDGIFVNRRDRIAYINPMGLQLLGAARPDQILGRSPLDIIHPDGHELVAQRIRALLEGQKYAPPIPEKFRRQDGSWLDVEVSATPIADEGEPAILVFFRDVTERKRAEDALRISESNLKEAKRLAGLGNWQWDLRTGVHTWSEEIYRIYGRDPALPPAAYPEVRKYFTPDSWANLAAVVEKSLTDGVPYECDAEVVRPDGTRRWITARGEATRDASGNIANLRGTVQDITERKQVEEALRESEAQLRLLTDALPVLISYVGPDKRYRYVNKGYEEWFGHSRAEVVGRRLDEVMGEAAYRTISEHVDAALSGRPVAYELTIPYRNAGTRHVRANYIPDVGADGRIKGFFALITDITERKQTEIALRERVSLQDQLAKVAATVPGTICTFKLRPDGTVCMPYASPAIEDVYGLRSEEVAEDASPIFAMMHPDDVRHVNETIAESARTMKPWRDEYRIRHSRKGEIWIEGYSMPLREPDGSILWHGFVHDITERKRTETELRERRTEVEQLLQLHVASQTAAAVAHELNQPLNAIASYNEAALRMLRAGNPKPGKLLHALESSVQQTQRVGRAMRHLLEFLHKGETVTEAVDLNQEVYEALNVVEADGYGGFRPVLELATDLPMVQANRIQVQRVLVNLLRNGVEAMRGAGLHAGPITVTVRTAAGENMALVTVRDSGPGLDPETARHVFEPFFTTKPEGIGMGLAISRALIEAHGGKLWAELEGGPGASFHFTLPFAS